MIYRKLSSIYNHCFDYGICIWFIITRIRITVVTAWIAKDVPKHATCSKTTNTTTTTRIFFTTTHIHFPWIQRLIERWCTLEHTTKFRHFTNVPFIQRLIEWWCIIVTLLTSHSFKGWLNDDAPLNILIK